MGSTLCIVFGLVASTARAQAPQPEPAVETSSSRVRFGLGVPLIQFARTEIDDTDLELTNITFALLTGTAEAELHVGNHIAMGGIGVGVVRTSIDDDGDELTELGWRVVPSLRLNPAVTDNVAVFLSLGFVVSGIKVDDDGDELESLEYGPNVQLGLHLFATRSFSVDPRLSLEYVIGSQEGDSFRDEVDYKRLRVGLQLAFSGWGGRDEDHPVSTDVPDATPALPPPPPPTRVQVRAQLVGGALELVGDASDASSILLRLETTSRQPALQSCTEAAFELDGARGVVREMTYEARASMAGVDERLSGWMTWEGVTTIAATSGVTLSLCGQRFHLDPALPALRDFVQRMRVAAAQMGVTPPTPTQGARAY